MHRIKFEIPNTLKFKFDDDLREWEKANYKDARLILGDADRPYKTTTRASPLVLTCEVDETFFEKYSEWRQYVVAAGDQT